jgi:hypothetical protein
MMHRRRRTTTPKATIAMLNADNRRNTEGDDAESSNGVVQTESKDTIMSLMSLHTPDQSKSAPPVEDVVLHVVPPSSMPRSTPERQARIHDIDAAGGSNDLRSTKINTSASSQSLKTESTANSSTHEDEPNQRNHSGSSSSSQEYEPGDFVEVRVGNIYQAGIIEKRCFKGVYNVTLFSDTPAWNEKRAHVDIYQQSPERMPEVLARDIRPFTPAPLGEIVYVYLNGNERKCCVHGYSYDSEDLTDRHLKYVVKFAKKNCEEWRCEKHRVPVQRAYRMFERQTVVNV